MLRNKEDKLLSLQQFLASGEKPAEWCIKNGFGKTYIHDLCKMYANKNNLSTRSVIDMLKLELIDVLDVSKCWRVLKPKKINKDNVVRLDCITRLNLNAADILIEISESNPSDVFVIVTKSDGEVTYHSSSADMCKLAFEVQRFIHKVFNGEFN